MAARAAAEGRHRGASCARSPTRSHGIHAHGILHRDLKPENVLVRTRAPLELALTDFGIASLSDATQHFTSAARTTKYAAPEVLTGVLDDKSDWWSLGMIVLEAASGRHPFDGLTEQVMNHQLATRPIDVRGVYDDALRVLCRGLLLRDPARRFGAARSRALARGRRDARSARGARGDQRAAVSLRHDRSDERARARARARQALGRSASATSRAARSRAGSRTSSTTTTCCARCSDIQDTRGLGEDGKLLRFLLAAAPDLPPVWRGGRSRKIR